MSSRREFMQRTVAALGTPLLAAAPARGQPPAAQPRPATSADVGSLFPFIQSQAVKRDFPLSFLRDEFRDVAAWKKRARAKLLELLHYAPPPCEPQAEVVERVDKGDYVREKITFRTTPDIRVPAYMLVPKGLSKPAPGVVALHDHGGFYLWGKEKLVETEGENPTLAEFKQRSYAGRSIATELARQGYVVVVIDMFYWGERRMLLDDDPADWRDRPRDISAERTRAFNQRASQNEQLVGRTIYSAGFTWPGVMFWDDLRTLDYLATRPEVDAKRLACVGLSVGGLRSCHLAALDDRIRAAVVVGWMASFPTLLRKHIRNTVGHTKAVPGLMRYMDYPDVAALAMPSALLVINGSQDRLFDLDGVRSCFDKLTACYKKAGAPDRFRGHLYDAPHEFNVAMQAEAWEWLKKWV
jgi:dienelactone hydrolase